MMFHSRWFNLHLELEIEFVFSSDGGKIHRRSFWNYYTFRHNNETDDIKDIAWSFRRTLSQPVVCGSCRYDFFFQCNLYISPIDEITLFSTANLIILSQGCNFGWIPPILPLWMSDDTPLSSGPMSTEEISWVVSIGSLGTLSAAFVFHSIVDRLGCKRTMTSCLTILSIVSHEIIQNFGTFLNEHFRCRFRGYY